MQARTIRVYDLKRKVFFEEEVYGGFWLRLVYRISPLRWIFSFGWIQKWISRVVGDRKRATASKNEILPFIERYKITMDKFVVPEGGFRTFNDFFIRKLKSPVFPADAAAFCSPCEARLSASRIDGRVPSLLVKGRRVFLPELLGREARHCPESGWALTFRLCPLDYHRFHFVDSGRVGAATKLGTALHSVNPWALEELPRIFEWNERQVALQEGEHYGALVYVEVGAMCVGRIHQSYSPGASVTRGEEKGYFDFGASTLVLLVGEEKGKLHLNQEILNQNQNGVEAYVGLGEEIGRWSPHTIS